MVLHCRAIGAILRTGSKQATRKGKAMLDTYRIISTQIIDGVTFTMRQIAYNALIVQRDGKGGYVEYLGKCDNAHIDATWTYFVKSNARQMLLRD